MRKAAPVRAFQICNGLGAGNIGDELMARAFWDQIGESMVLDVAVFPEYKRQHQPYPPAHSYVSVDSSGNENSSTALPGLLVGDTPVSEVEGLHWPLQFLSRRLCHFHSRSLPVDALGVGVDRLRKPESIELFRRGFLPIRSWTVRSSNCREALLALGVPEHKIIIGADWAWLYRPHCDLAAWAESQWRSLSIDPYRPLLVVNNVNLVWSHRTDAKQAVAAALDSVSKKLGLQIAFFCNECREGDYFDMACASEVRSHMQCRSVIVPNEYYGPDEVLALLRFATVVLSQRYHLALMAVLAGTVPVIIVRGQKLSTLADDLGLLPAGSMDQLDAVEISNLIEQSVLSRTQLIAHLDFASRHLTARAHNNLGLIRFLPPYVDANAVGVQLPVGGNVTALCPESGDDAVQRWTAQRLQDLSTIRDAVETYYSKHKAYPKSSGGWDGLYSKWGASTPEWIPGLVPEYLPCLPRDPRNHDLPDQQYLYKSDGRDFKLISHAPWDEEIVRQRHPDMMDPARPGWAYGFWTNGAKNW